jgi:hypothetical protein
MKMTLEEQFQNLKEMMTDLREESGKSIGVIWEIAIIDDQYTDEELAGYFSVGSVEKVRILGAGLEDCKLFELEDLYPFFTEEEW